MLVPVPVPVPVPVLMPVDRKVANERKAERREPRLLERMRACEASSKKTDASEDGRG